MKLYIAGNFERREFFKSDVVPALENAGLQISSRWLQIEHRHPDSEAYCQQWSRWDIEDIAKSDGIVVELAEASRTQHGKHFELGYAVALGKHVYLIGCPFHIFHWFAEKVFVDWEAFIRYMAGSGYERDDLVLR